MPAASIHTDQWAKYVDGTDHPLKPIRLYLTYELMRAYGLLDGPAHTIPAIEASTDALLRFHAPEYLQVLEAVSEGVTVPTMNRYGLGPGDNPVFPGLLRFSALALARSTRLKLRVLCRRDLRDKIPLASTGPSKWRFSER